MIYNDYQAWGLTVVRIMLGVTFIMHGSQKVFGLFGGQGLTKFALYVQDLGAPGWLGVLAAFCEFFGGILLLTGIFAELGALLVVPVMITAIALVHRKNGYFLQNNGYEYALNLLILAIFIVVSGSEKCRLINITRQLNTLRC
jgi:putative oxidoreductase